METFIYDGKGEKLQKALEVHSSGGRVLCYKCNTELLIISDSESAKKHKMESEIYCPVNSQHIYQILILAEPFEEFRRRFGLD